MNPFVLAALLALGLLMLLKPDFLWGLEQLLLLRQGEPSRLYVTLMRVGGVFVLAFALAGMAP